MSMDQDAKRRFAPVLASKELRDQMSVRPVPHRSMMEQGMDFLHRGRRNSHRHPSLSRRLASSYAYILPPRLGFLPLFYSETRTIRQVLRARLAFGPNQLLFDSVWSEDAGRPSIHHKPLARNDVETDHAFGTLAVSIE
jgi:hypothetical protein